MQDIKCALSQVYFNYRVAAIIRYQNHLLINQLKGQDFWFLPGGRVQEGESSYSAIQREVFEELSSACTIKSAAFLLESFFYLGERSFHELCFYYPVELPEASVLYQQESWETEMDGGISFRWQALDDLASINFQPAVLRARLAKLPERLEHIIHDEGSG